MVIFVSLNAFTAIVLFIYFQNNILDKYTTHTAFLTYNDLKSMVWLLLQILTVVPLSPVPGVALTEELKCPIGMLPCNSQFLQQKA
jgi:hypothetical protein